MSISQIVTLQTDNFVLEQFSSFYRPSETAMNRNQHNQFAHPASETKLERKAIKTERKAIQDKQNTKQDNTK